jgi:hypothetical protein
MTQQELEQLIENKTKDLRDEITVLRKEVTQATQTTNEFTVKLRSLENFLFLDHKGLAKLYEKFKCRSDVE